jgi:hypothetical protein
MKFPPRRNWGALPLPAMRGESRGEGASPLPEPCSVSCDASASFLTLRIAERPPHPPAFATLRRIDLSPHAGRGVGKPLPFSRCAFFAPRALSTPFPKHRPRTTPHCDLRQSLSAWIVRMAHDRHGARTNGRKEKTARKQNADRRVVKSCTCRRSAHPAGRARLSAFHCGSRQGDSWSPRLSVRPCFPGRSGAFDPVRPLQPGSGDLARLRGRYPRRNNKRTSQSSEHLACRSLCRQD